MIEIISDATPAEQHLFAMWAIERLNDDSLQTVEDIGPYRAFGIKRNGKAAAVIIWNWFRGMRYGSDIRVIVVADDPRWCLPGVLRELFSYPFVHLDCTRITLAIRDGNERSLKLAKGLGFRKEGVLRRGYNGRTNAILLGMLREECKWIKPRTRATRELSRNGQEIAEHSSAARSSEDDRGANPGKQRSASRKRSNKRR